jgi:hypothetical protein
MGDMFGRMQGVPHSEGRPADHPSAGQRRIASPKCPALQMCRQWQQIPADQAFGFPIAGQSRAQVHSVNCCPLLEACSHRGVL